MKAITVKMAMIVVMALVVTVTIGNLGFGGSGVKTVAAANSPAPTQSPDDYLRAFTERMDSPEAQARIRAMVLKLELAYPRLAQAVRNSRIDLQTFLALRRNDKEAANLLARFENGEITARRLVKLIGTAGKKKDGNAGDVQIMGACYNNCETWADMFYMGCRHGGGDAFTCFVETEAFLCMCRNGCTEEPNYIYIECWEGYPN